MNQIAAPNFGRNGGSLWKKLKLIYNSMSDLSTIIRCLWLDVLLQTSVEIIENKTRYREIALMLHVRVDASTAAWTKLSHYLA